MNRFRDAGTSRTAGSLRLSVRYDGKEPDRGGYQSRYAYTVTSTEAVPAIDYRGSDLLSAVGAEPTSEKMVRILAESLDAAGDRYQTRRRAPDEEYPAWLCRAAFSNSTDLAMLQLEQDDIDNGRLVVRYADVIFQHGEDADEALKILDARGEESAVEYLAQWDSLADTDAGPRADYDELPAGQEDRVYTTDTYVLSYNLPRGYIGLVRKVLEYHDQSAAEAACEVTPPSRKLNEFGDCDRYCAQGSDRIGSPGAFRAGPPRYQPGL